jgi:hypothetical protein
VQHVAVKIHVAGERDRDHLERAHARHEFGRHHRAMLDAKARIAARKFALQLLVGAEDAVDGALAVRVRRELKSRAPGFA